MKPLPEDFLSGYLDGESLTDEERRYVEKALETDPQLRQEYESLSALKHLLTTRAATSPLALRPAAAAMPESAQASVLAALAQEYAFSTPMSSTLHPPSSQSPQPPHTGTTTHQPSYDSSHLEVQPALVSGRVPLRYQAADRRAAENTNRRRSVANGIFAKSWWIAAAVVVIVTSYTVWTLVLSSVDLLDASKNVPENTSSKAQTNTQQPHSSSHSAVSSHADDDNPHSSATMKLIDFRVAALNNYKAVMNGSIHLQHETTSFEDLQAFFREHGINYTLIRPKIKAKLIGGVVSEENGEKSAHLVFRSGDTLLYMWQVAEHIPAHATAHGGTAYPEPRNFLLDTVITRVTHHNGDWYWEEHTGAPTLAVWEDRSTLCVMIAQLPQRKMQALFQ
jgi:anti-sigma factor RsiW